MVEPASHIEGDPSLAARAARLHRAGRENAVRTSVSGGVAGRLGLATQQLRRTHDVDLCGATSNVDEALRDAALGRVFGSRGRRLEPEISGQGASLPRKGPKAGGRAGVAGSKAEPEAIRAVLARGLLRDRPADEGAAGSP